MIVHYSTHLKTRHRPMLHQQTMVQHLWLLHKCRVQMGLFYANGIV